MEFSLSQIIDQRTVSPWFIGLTTELYVESYLSRRTFFLPTTTWMLSLWTSLVLDRAWVFIPSSASGGFVFYLSSCDMGKRLWCQNLTLVFTINTHTPSHSHTYRTVCTTFRIRSLRSLFFHPRKSGCSWNKGPPFWGKSFISVRLPSCSFRSKQHVINELPSSPRYVFMCVCRIK